MGRVGGQGLKEDPGGDIRAESYEDREKAVSADREERSRTPGLCRGSHACHTGEITRRPVWWVHG